MFIIFLSKFLATKRFYREQVSLLAQLLQEIETENFNVLIKDSSFIEEFECENDQITRLKVINSLINKAIISIETMKVNKIKNNSIQSQYIKLLSISNLISSAVSGNKLGLSRREISIMAEVVSAFDVGKMSYIC